MYISIKIECQPQLIIDYKINFQDCKFLICFYSLSNELSNKSFIIFFLFFYFGMLILRRNKTCVFVSLIFVIYFFRQQCQDLYNFKSIEYVLISLIQFILDISGEFKVMHFTSSNLLHDFPNGKYMLFSLLKKKKKIM